MTLLHPAPNLTYFSAPDGKELLSRVWSRPRPAARVVFLHGIISHGGWYVESCRYLATQNYEVHFVDRRGSGLNMEHRGDVARCRDWLDDVAAYLQQLPDDAPRVLLGISWGGKLASAVAAEYAELLDGFGMLCPGLFAHQQVRPWTELAVRNLVRLGWGAHRVTIPLQQAELFTAALSHREYIRRDPLTLRKITLRFAAEDLKLNRLARDTTRGSTLPALLMLAGKDRIVHNERTRQFFRKLPTGPKTSREYLTAEHTLEFEPDPQPYWRDLAQWIESL